MNELTVPKLITGPHHITNNYQPTSESSVRSSPFQNRPSKLVINQFPPNSRQHSPVRSSKVEKSVKINKIFQKELNKLKISQKDKSQKFDERMKTFEGLNTFVDIRDYLQQMNSTNVTMRSLQSSQFLPPVDASKYGSIVLSSREVETTCTDKGSYTPSFAFETRRTNGRTMSDVKYYLSKATNIHDDPFVSKVLNSATEGIKSFNASSMSSVINEDMRADGYSIIFNDIVEKEKEQKLKEMNIMRVSQDEVNYYKNQLKFIPVSAEYDENYYKDYKHRADKIISLLKSSSKKIYNKTFSEVPNLKQIKEKGIQRKKVDLKKDLRPMFKNYMSSGNFLQGNCPPSIFKPEETLKTKFVRMQTRVNTLHTISQDQPKTPKNEVDDILDNRREKSQNGKFNRQINKLHKNFMNKLVAEVEMEEVHYKNLKRQIQSEINTIEESYNGSIEQLFPRELESIRCVDLNYVPSHLDKKIFRKNFSKDLLGLALKPKN